MSYDLTIKGNVVNVTIEQVHDVYNQVGAEVGRYLRGDYYIRIQEADRVIHISDFGGTKSAGFMPRNTTMIVKDGEPVQYFPTYGARELYVLQGKLLAERDLIRRQSYTHFFHTIDKAIDKRRTENNLVFLSGGIDSGTIAASLSAGKREYTVLSSVVNEDKDVIEQRHKLATAARIIPSVTYDKLVEDTKQGTGFSEVDALACLSHYAAAREVKPGEVVLSGLGVDELYDINGPREQILADFLRTSELVYEHFGLDVRYPLLDYNVWLEYNRLVPSLRNQPKKPFIKYLEYRKYPLQREKHHFIAWTEQDESK